MKECDACCATKHVECRGTETAGGLEVCVLDEAKISQKGTFQVAAGHEEQAVKGQDCGTASRIW